MADDESFEQQQIRLMVEAENERRAMTFRQRLAKFEDFRFDRDQVKYWDLYTGVLYTAPSVDSIIPQELWPTKTANTKGGGKRLVRTKPSLELQRVENGCVVDCSTWWPGRDLFLLNELVTQRGPQIKPGCITYNTYIAPDHSELDTEQTPDLWINHVKTLFPDEKEHEHFFNYAAHMLQKPHEKINHGVVVSGAQGIGKDTMLLPLRWGVGLWNTAEIGPDDIEARFNPYVQAVMLVVNEVRPHNEGHRASGFYNRMKPYLAAPPETLPMEMKQCHIVYVRNVMRVFLTTNDYQTMHVPEEDRRLFIMHSFLEPLWTENNYFKAIFNYFKTGGMSAVINWLLSRDLSGFEPGAHPPMTAGKFQVMTSTKMVRRSIIHEAFDAMVGDGPEPDVFFLPDLKNINGEGAPSFDDLDALIAALRHPSLIHKIQELGYDCCRHPEAKKWRWKRTFEGKQIIFQTEIACVKKNIFAEKRWDLIDKEGRKRVTARVEDPF